MKLLLILVIIKMAYASDNSPWTKGQNCTDDVGLITFENVRYLSECSSACKNKTITDGLCEFAVFYSNPYPNGNHRCDLRSTCKP